MFEKIIEISPAFDKEDYGVRDCLLIIVLKGEKGAVQFILGTGWYLDFFKESTPHNLGYYSPNPLYEKQKCTEEKCKYLDNKPCYYNGSRLNAQRIYKILLEKGLDGVWEELEKYYKEIFIGEK